MANRSIRNNYFPKAAGKKKELKLFFYCRKQQYRGETIRITITNILGAHITVRVKQRKKCEITQLI